MRVLAGRVENGRIVPLRGTLPEGIIVTVVVPDDVRTFELSPEQETALQHSFEEAERGDVVSAEEVLAGLRRQGLRLRHETKGDFGIRPALLHRTKA